MPSDVEKVIDPVLLIRHGQSVHDPPYDVLQDWYYRLRLQALSRSGGQASAPRSWWGR